MPRNTMSDRMRAKLECSVRLLEEKVAKLKEELWLERHEVISRLPLPAYRLLASYRQPTTKEELYEWKHQLVESALELASPKSGDEMNARWYNGDRAHCPLCGGSSAAIMRAEDTGFAFPKGLKMHLLGDGGAKECEMVAVARRMAKAEIEGLGH